MYGANIYQAFIKPLAKIYETCIKHLSSTYQTFMKRLPNIYQAFIRPLAKIYETCVKHLANIYQTCSKHLSNMYWSIWIWGDMGGYGRTKAPWGVPGGSQGGPRGVPGGQTISHHSDCPFCGVKVKNPSQNIKKTKAPAPRQHNLMYRAINASRHQSSRRGAFTLVFLMFLLGKKVHFVE